MINLTETMNRYEARSKYEMAFETNKWIKAVPTLNFKEHWNVKILPPFGGAIIRFWVDSPTNHVSVYLDGYDVLGSMGEPYWEVYGGCDEECVRFLFEEHEKMMAYIEKSLR